MALKATKVAVLIASLVLTLLTLVAGVWSMIRPGNELQAAVMAASFAALGLGLGLSVAWQSLGSLLGRPSRPFRPLPAWPLVSLFVGVVIAGQGVLISRLWPGLIFPPLHVLAAFLPASFILALAGRRLAGADWRQIILQMGGGALAATGLAMTAELVALLLLATVAAGIVALMPGGVEQLKHVMANLRTPGWLDDPVNLSRFLLSAPVATVVGLLFVVIAPLIEEACKPLGVLLMSYRRPTHSQALLWGLASGAGFAIAEGLFNGALSLRGGWAFVMMVRAGATLMHCLGSGLVGLGWSYFLESRRPWRLLAGYAVGVGLHMLWNAATVIFAVAGLGAWGGGSTFARMGTFFSLEFLLLLMVSMAGLLLFVIGRVRNEQGRATRSPLPGGCGEC